MFGCYEQNRDVPERQRLTDEAELRELQDHPLLQGLLQGEVLHGGEVVRTGDDVVLQL